jgi:hypothetical protein
MLIPTANRDIDHQQVTLLDSPDNDWEWGGFANAGGVVVLGNNVDILKSPSSAYHLKPSERQIRMRLGGLLLSAVGFNDWEISQNLDFKYSTYVEVMRTVRKLLCVPKRHMLLPAAIRADVLRVKSYGPADNFHVNPTKLLKLGLLGCVERRFVKKAFGLRPSSLDSEISVLSARERVLRLGGCISAAVLTHQLGAKTCIPLIQSPESIFGVKPLIPVPEWNALVESDSEDEFVSNFKALNRGIT